MSRAVDGERALTTPPEQDGDAEVDHDDSTALPCRILVVDDEPVMREVLNDTLS